MVLQGIPPVGALLLATLPPRCRRRLPAGASGSPSALSPPAARPSVRARLRRSPLRDPTGGRSPPRQGANYLDLAGTALPSFASSAPFSERVLLHGLMFGHFRFCLLASCFGAASFLPGFVSRRPVKRAPAGVLGLECPNGIKRRRIIVHQRRTISARRHSSPSFLRVYATAARVMSLAASELLIGRRSWLFPFLPPSPLLRSPFFLPDKQSMQRNCTSL